MCVRSAAATVASPVAETENPTDHSTFRATEWNVLPEEADATAGLVAVRT